MLLLYIKGCETNKKSITGGLDAQNPKESNFPLEKNVEGPTIHKDRKLFLKRSPTDHQRPIAKEWVLKQSNHCKMKLSLKHRTSANYCYSLFFFLFSSVIYAALQMVLESRVGTSGEIDGAQ